MIRRIAILLLLTVDAFAHVSCATEGAPPIETDLAALALSFETKHPRAMELSDGSILVPPGLRASWDARRRLTERGREAIPELMRLAESNPRMTGAGLIVVAEILASIHSKPFEIPRAGNERSYWAIREPTGEGLIIMEPADVAREREQALNAFRAWLFQNGYIP